MREKIETIIAELVSGSGLTPKEAINQILLLFNVSGNEDQPKENKKESEVVVCGCTHTQACKICAEAKGIDWSIFLAAY